MSSHEVNHHLKYLATQGRNNSGGLSFSQTIGEHATKLYHITKRLQACSQPNLWKQIHQDEWQQPSALHKLIEAGKFRNHRPPKAKVCLHYMKLHIRTMQNSQKPGRCREAEPELGYNNLGCVISSLLRHPRPLALGSWDLPPPLPSLIMPRAEMAVQQGGHPIFR
jgi:hypothetical protein